jgi:hypothetical protein
MKKIVKQKTRIKVRQPATGDGASSRRDRRQAPVAS